MKGWGPTSVSISKSSPKNSYTFPTSIKDKVFEGQIDIFLPWMNIDTCQSFWVNIHSRRRRSGSRWWGTNFWRGNIWKVWQRLIHKVVPSGVHAWTDFKMRNVHSITDWLNMDAIKIEKKKIFIFFLSFSFLLELELRFIFYLRAENFQLFSGVPNISQWQDYGIT